MVPNKSKMEQSYKTPNLTLKQLCCSTILQSVAKGNVIKPGNLNKEKFKLAFKDFPFNTDRFDEQISNGLIYNLKEEMFVFHGRFYVVVDQQMENEMMSEPKIIVKNFVIAPGKTSKAILTMKSMYISERTDVYLEVHQGFLSASDLIDFITSSIKETTFQLDFADARIMVYYKRFESSFGEKITFSPSWFERDYSYEDYIRNNTKPYF